MGATADLGSYVEIDGRPAVRFERVYHHPIERVWGAITDPAELARWFPAPKVTMQPRVGGDIHFSGDPHGDDQPGTILTWHPPTRLAFTWGPDELRFELDALDARSCRLVLLNVLERRDAAARNGAGWLICLAELARAIVDAPGDGPHSESAMTSWLAAYEAHIAVGLPHGAPIPPQPDSR